MFDFGPEKLPGPFDKWTPGLARGLFWLMEGPLIKQVKRARENEATRTTGGARREECPCLFAAL